MTAQRASAAGGKQKFTVYAVATTAQFMNHADDRIRGMSANPFIPNEQALVIVSNGKEKQKGPFPGDDILYTFKLYPTANLTKSNGSAFFTCYYAFAKRASARPTTSWTAASCWRRERSPLAAPASCSRWRRHPVVSRSTLRGRAAPAGHGLKNAERLDFVLLGS